MHRVVAQELKGRLVVTKSGTKLGNFKDFIIDVDSGRVLQYVVSRGLIMPDPDLLIGIDEIIEIREDIIVVKDTLIGEGTPALA